MFLDKRQFEPCPEDEVDLPEMTGPKRFLQIIQVEFLSIIKLNLLLLAGCIPLVTIPISLFAAHRVARKMVLGETVVCWRDYKEGWKTGWKQGYSAFFLTAIPMGLGAYGASFYLSHAQQSLFLIFPFAFCMCVFLVAALSSTYLYGFLCDGRPVKEAVRYALLLGVAKPLRAFLAALCWYALPLLAILFFPFSGAYLALIGFSFPLLLGGFYTRTVLKQFCGE